MAQPTLVHRKKDWVEPELCDRKLPDGDWRGCYDNRGGCNLDRSVGVAVPFHQLDLVLAVGEQGDVFAAVVVVHNAHRQLCVDRLRKFVHPFDDDEVCGAMPFASFNFQSKTNIRKNGFFLKKWQLNLQASVSYNYLNCCAHVVMSNAKCAVIKAC